MYNKEIALKLATAAIAGGAINFEKEDNKANIEKIINFYDEMEDTINERNKNDKTDNWGAQIFDD